MSSMEPAVAAMLAYILLDDRLGAGQWLAIAMIMAASMGSSYMAQRQKRAPAAAVHT